MSNFLTIHQLVSIPWSNLNRDDTGTPKRLFQGGVLRGQLSSQSIKRAIRVAYENASHDISIRSGNLADLVVKRVLEIEPNFDEKTAQAIAKKVLDSLVKAGENSKISLWFSGEEIETCAAAIATGQLTEDKFGKKAGKTESLETVMEPVIHKHQTGSLAIAAFGRMFASMGEMSTEAAVAVSPAVSTHQAIIETDFFSTVEDNPREEDGAGSTYLGTGLFTSGCFYRTVTIDRKQLRESWTGIATEAARDNLAAMVEALIYSLPRGKKNGTAPYVMPGLLLAEEQSHRVAYDFETPVRAGKAGGFMENSISELLKQFESARSFDPDNFGLTVLSGTAEGLEKFGLGYSNKTDFINQIVDWILQ